MNYKERYEQALERARIGLHDCNLLDCDNMTRRAAITTIYHLFPELIGSDDERIRKGIIRNLQYLMDRSEGFVKEDLAERIAWLEKQGEPNPYSGTSFKYNGNTYGMCIRDGGLDILYNNTLIHHIDFTSQDKSDKKDKVEPKFHKGDWVILTAGELSTTLQIVNVDTNKKLYWFNDSSYLPIVDEECLHLWTINDAKDGDVLASKDGDDILIFRNIDTSVSFSSYYNIVRKRESNWDNTRFFPATKEQHDLLFAKMKDSGYEWDANKKELKKIEHTLNANKVIGWLVANICDFEYYVKRFKQDFGL